MARWPHDDPASLAAFYGNPDRGEPGNRLVPVVPPFKMYYGEKPVEHIMFHEKAAPALREALQAIWEYYGKDQAKIDALRISRFSGSYNPRKIAGSTKWSNHAYGAAIDLDSEHNGFNTGHGTMPKAVVDCFKSTGAMWGGDYHGRTDPMHFEYCSRGDTAVVEKPKPPTRVATPVPSPPPKPIPKPPPIPVPPKPKPLTPPVVAAKPKLGLPKKPTDDEVVDRKLKDLEPKEK